MPIIGKIGTPQYIPTFKFLVTIDGVSVDALEGWSKVSGVKWELEEIKTRTGTDFASDRKLPGRLAVGDVTMERPSMGADVMYQWSNRCARGANERHTVHIQMQKSDGSLVRQITLFGAWVKSAAWPDLDASASNMGMEAYTLAVEMCEITA
ncbi:MAG: phage tail protein [Proteobacteria bacterium]|jgi:phage tail-like protein|nr:phage tail protein [Pseudomonadota bacterium]